MSTGKVLVIGSGGREHAICWKLSQSSKVQKIFALPGSFGIGQLAKCENLKAVAATDFDAVAKWCQQNAIDFVVVGPEDPLAGGIGDALAQHKVLCFGPGAAGAQIEADKDWAKNFMKRNGIPTARFESFTDAQKAKDFIRKAPYKALVVKASGLAAGKGVVVAPNVEVACQAVDEILGEHKFGAAGDVVVIEELLTGEEVSVLAFVDADSVRPMLPAQDHKRLLNRDEGPNTGGMGAYCPCPLITEADLDYVREHCLQKAVDSLRLEGIPYCGVLYAGLMLTPDGPKVLEYNCRFGDPETQVVLPLLQNDLYDVMKACCNGRLGDIELTWRSTVSAVGVIMASAGYPETSTKGCVIEGIPSDTDSQLIFHSGVAVNEAGQFLTNGGRVLIAVSLKPNLKTAAAEATKICQGITFTGKGAQYRTDIAEKAFKFLPLSYKDSGVDIDAGDDLVQKIKPFAKATHRPGVVGGIGGFGGLFRLNELGLKTPLLSEATRGVGSKIKLALKCGSYESIGNDLFAMCANDILETGAEPICFLDYIACGKLEVTVASKIVKGIAESCVRTNCALLGGETAEMPSVYDPGTYDVAGYCVGVVEEKNILPRSDSFEDGDLLIGLPSSGLHCDGFELLWPLLLKSSIDLAGQFGDGTKTLGQELLRPSNIYVKDILPLIKKGVIKAVVHVTDGFMTSAQRIMPANGGIEVRFDSIDLPDIFGWLSSTLGVCDADLLESFNCGMGLLFVVAADCRDYESIPGAKVLGRVLTENTPADTLIIRNFQDALEKVAVKFSKVREVQTGLSREVKNDVKRSLYKMVDESEASKKELLVKSGQKRLSRVPPQYRDPVLVIGTDGVGTKIKIAQIMRMNSTVGIDLVAMCVNDILCNGAVPLSFLSYYACGQLVDDKGTAITQGVLEGANQARCNLIDAHAVEIPLVYDYKGYDLAGFALGVAENEGMLPHTKDICEGDIIIALPSSGVHSNGFSLIHKIMERVGAKFTDKAPFGNKTYGEEFLTPTKIYVRALTSLILNKCVKAIAHITGGGLIENIPRVLEKHMAVRLDANKFNILPVFGWLAENGKVPSYEMLRTYNCGIGAVIVLDPYFESVVMAHIHLAHKAVKIGTVVQRVSTNTPQVVVQDFDKCLARVQRTLKTPKKRVAVLISGSGTNLQALIDASRDSAMGLGVEIVLVVSNKSEVLGLERAAKAGIDSAVISHKDFATREKFDEEMSRRLVDARVDIVCLAGFMRILSEGFVRQWKGKLINIHPSLLPKHPGLHVQQKAIDAGDKQSGCTIHFVDEGVDTGAIILQDVVPIMPPDTVELLTWRIQKAEHYAFPIALRMVATGAVTLGTDGKTIFH